MTYEVIANAVERAPGSLRSSVVFVLSSPGLIVEVDVIEQDPLAAMEMTGS